MSETTGNTNHYGYRCLECGKACETVEEPEPTKDGLMGLVSACCRADFIVRIVSSREW